MPESHPSRATLRHAERRKRRARRVGIIALCVVLAAVIGAVAWVGVRGFMAKSDLEAAQSMIGQLKLELADLNVDGARETFNLIREHTKSARELSSDQIWRATEVVPWLGKNLTVVREIAEVTDNVMSGVGAPLVDIAEEINPASFTPKDGAIDLAPFERAAPVVVEATTQAKAALANAQAIDAEDTISQVAEAKVKFVSLLDGLVPTLDTLATVVPLLPPALGSEGPRTYVIMFQNPAEARTLGGTALSFAVLKVDHGRIDLEDAIPAGSDRFTHFASSVIPIPDGAKDVYPGGAFGTFIANATVRPSFTTAAEITREMWNRLFGYPVDGVISIDPVALSYVLRATAPIPLASGDTLSSANLVSLLLNEVYLRYNSGDSLEDNRAQDAVYSDAVDATFDRLIGGPMDPKVLMAALMQGWDEHRILFWSAHDDEESALAEVGLNGELPVSNEEYERFGVYVEDNVGSKLNFYLTSTVQLSQAQCVSGQQNYRVTIDLTSTLPLDKVSALSPSIAGQWKREGLTPGQQRMNIYLYAPPGTTIVGATVNGEAIVLPKLHDTDYPVGRVNVIVNPASTVTLTYDVVGDSTPPKQLEALVTPMVHPTPVTVAPLECATVSKGE